MLAIQEAEIAAQWGPMATNNNVHVFRNLKSHARCMETPATEPLGASEAPSLHTLDVGAPEGRIGLARGGHPAREVLR